MPKRLSKVKHNLIRVEHIVLEPLRAYYKVWLLAPNSGEQSFIQRAIQNWLFEHLGRLVGVVGRWYSHMSRYTDVKIFQNMLRDPSPDNCRPPWWVIAIAIFAVMSMLGL